MMNKTLTLSKKSVVVKFNFLSELLADLFESGTSDAAGKKKPLKMLKHHVNALEELPIDTELKSVERDQLSEKVLGVDIELKILLELLLESEKCRHDKVRKEVMAFVCHTVGNIKFLNPDKRSKVFLLDDISDDNTDYLPALVKEIKGRFDKYKGESYKPKQKKILENNVLAIAHIWVLEDGKATTDEVLNSLNQVMADETSIINLSSLNTGYIRSADRKSVYFLASQINSLSADSLFKVLSYFKSHQEKAHDELLVANGKSIKLNERIETINSEKEQLAQELANKEEQITQLKDEIALLNKQSSESEQSLKAQKVHLKDDTSKAKAKALNFLEEEMLTTLKNTFKALDRDTPKVHVAVHNIDVMIERAEEVLEWFKK